MQIDRQSCRLCKPILSRSIWIQSVKPAAISHAVYGSLTGYY